MISSWWFSGIFHNNNNNNNLHLTTNGKKCEKNIVILQIKYSWWRYFTSKFYISHFTFHKRIIFKFFFLVLKQKQNKHGEHMQHIVSLSTIFHHLSFFFLCKRIQLCFIYVWKRKFACDVFFCKNQNQIKIVKWKKKYNWILSAKKGKNRVSFWLFSGTFFGSQNDENKLSFLAVIISFQ